MTLQDYLIESVARRKSGKYKGLYTSNFDDAIRLLEGLGFDRLNHKRFTYNKTTNGNLQDHGSKCFADIDWSGYYGYADKEEKFQIAVCDGNDKCGWLWYDSAGNLIPRLSQYFEGLYGRMKQNANIQLLGENALDKIESDIL